MSYIPKSSLDLSGWTPITCWQSEIVLRHDLVPAVGGTDMDADQAFAEWWTPDSEVIPVPVLRSYRRDGVCSHYLAEEPYTAAAYTEENR